MLRKRRKPLQKAVKASQKEFVERLASYADCYINDAFGTAHRAHASTALIADKFPHDKMFGYVMENELQAVDRLMLNPRRPFAAIIGGSKVSTKISILENLMGKGRSRSSSAAVCPTPSQRRRAAKSVTRSASRRCSPRHSKS